MLKIYSEKLHNNEYSAEEKNKFEIIIQKLGDLYEIEFHRESANRQKQAYNRMIKDETILEDSIIIEVRKI